MSLSVRAISLAVFAHHCSLSYFLALAILFQRQRSPCSSSREIRYSFLDSKAILVLTQRPFLLPTHSQRPHLLASSLRWRHGAHSSSVPMLPPSEAYLGLSFCIRACLALASSTRQHPRGRWSPFGSCQRSPYASLIN
jgi:hypothetical protein